MNAPNRPNIVFLFSDQQRWDTLGCYGQPLDVTPNLDRLAAEGTRFVHSFTCQPVCGPARACLQTGRWATQVGCWRNDIALPTDADTLAKRLGGAGYQTAYVGKWHLASTGPEADYRTRPVPPQRRGGYEWWLAADVLEFTSHARDGHMFDGEGRKVEMPPGRYRADFVTDGAVRFLDERDEERPFFLFVSWIEPHHQNDADAFQGPEGSRERFADFQPPEDLVAAGDDAGDWRESYPDYLGCCAALDANVGRLMDELRRRGLAENTVVIYTSDHGCHFRTRNAEYKRSCHEGSIRTPLIAWGPRFAAGGEVRELVSLIDLPPTVCTAAGLQPPAHMVGRALQPLASGRAEGWFNEVFVQISESQVGRAIRNERWKYAVVAPDADGGEQPAAERYVEHALYDLSVDPAEQENLIGRAEFRDIARRLRARLSVRMVEAGEPEPRIDPAV